MASEQAEYTEPSPKATRHSRRRIVRVVFIVASVVLVVGVLGYVLVTKFITPKSNGSTEKVLTLSDLDNPATPLNSQTSDASVGNLAKDLKANIDVQIANKENPITNVRTLVGVLCSTANADRPTQCIDYILEFLSTKMDSLKLASEEYGQPDEFRITFWRAQFYEDLVYNYEFIMNNKFTGSDGEPLTTTTEQLKYINLYLEIAQNAANWGEPQISTQDGHTWYYYEYKQTNNFIERRQQLEAGGAS